MTRLGTTLLAVSLSLAFADEPQRDPFAGAPSKTLPSSDDTFKIHLDPSGRPYFAKGTESYYTKYLAAMKEPSLLERGDKRPSFEVRFLWLRSFHDPVSVRVWKTDDGFMLRVVRIKQNKDYTLAATLVDTTRLLDGAESKAFLAILGAAPLSAPMNETEELSGAGGMDGAQWIFESYIKQKYQRQEFWCLKDFGPTRYEKMGLDTSKLRDTPSLLKFALGLLKLGGIKIPDDEVY